MVSIVMVGEGPPSTSYGPDFNKDVDANPSLRFGQALRRQDVGRLPQVNTQGRWYHGPRLWTTQAEISPV